MKFFVILKIVEPQKTHFEFFEDFRMIFLKFTKFPWNYLNFTFSGARIAFPAPDLPNLNIPCGISMVLDMTFHPKCNFHLKICNLLELSGFSWNHHKISGNPWIYDFSDITQKGMPRPRVFLREYWGVAHSADFFGNLWKS